MKRSGIASRIAPPHNAPVRIIAGEFRGRKLLPPKGETTRPITDRVKQSLFDILTPLLPDARVYDCFAGTGSLGLEALSRGAEHVIFFEADRSAITLLQRNVASLKVEARCTVVSTDIFKWFDTAPSPDRRADIVFLDPPYRFLRERREDLEKLAWRIVSAHMAANGTIVFRHGASDTLALPGTHMHEARQYGNMVLEFLHRDEGA